MRHVWIARRQPFMASHLERLAFIDGEALARHRSEGDAERCQDEHGQDHRLGALRPAPRRSCAVRTLEDPDLRCRIAPRPARRTMGDRLRHECRVVRPLYQNPTGPDTPGRGRRSARSLGPMAFGASLLDNLSSHKSPAAAGALRDIGAWFLFLPPDSPDLNPIEMAFTKLKALIGKAATGPRRTPAAARRAPDAPRLARRSFRQNAPSASPSPAGAACAG